MKIWQSLRYRFLITMLLGGLFVTAVGTVYIYDKTKVDAVNQLIWEGAAIGSALNHASKVADTESEVQHVVEEVFRETSKLLLVLLEVNSRVIASSQTNWVGLSIHQLPSEITHEIIGTEATTHFHKVKWKNTSAIPVLTELSSPLSEHTHVHSDIVTDHIGAKNKLIDENNSQNSAMSGHSDVTAVADHDNSSLYSDQDVGLVVDEIIPLWQTTESSRVRGKILILIDEASVVTKANTNALRMASGFALGIMLTMLLSFMLTTRLVLGPLHNISQTMKRRLVGDLGARAKAFGQGELSKVAHTLNGMLDTLEDNEKSLRQLTQAVEQSPASVVITDKQGIVQYVNKQYCLNTGYLPSELIGNTPAVVQSGTTPDETYKHLWEVISSGGQWYGELHNRKKNGELIWENVVISPIFDDLGNITQYLGLKEDITQRKMYEKRLVRQANYDDLTGLPNRILAQDRLKQAMAVAHRLGKDTKVALLLLDLDDFKKINDTMGHDVGDQLLQEVANRFQGVIRETDTVARFGGDEFIVIMTNVNTQVDIECMAEKLLKQLSRSFNLGGMSFYINATIGISLYPDDDQTVQGMLQDADAALNRCKQEGRGQFSFFTSKMNDDAVENLKLEQALQNALQNNELEVHYQPVINCKNGKIVGAEALLRWNHPEMGSIPPVKFIPLAERTNLIQRIGNWVLRESCKTAVRWVCETDENFRIAVNLSSKQFGGDRLLKEVKAALTDSGLPPKNLELEFTESLLMLEDENTMAVINELHEMGIRFAIDDFGTGYSSISYLRQYPFDTLKIDRSFVTDVTTNSNDASLVNSIVAMADSLKLEVLAEGIEEISQFNYLSGAGTSRCQGWLFSKAIPEHEFTYQLKNWISTGAYQKALGKDPAPIIT